MLVVLSTARPFGSNGWRVRQNKTWREWCCIALPKRVRTHRALCKLYEQDALVFSARASLCRCDRMLSIISP
ncbi:unnamed protein product [Penicillium salamii]|nr:unnamed protein product [Penicillium salamii]CAG8141423.1 unnamed protein product [Penicillium salamii]